MSRPSGEYRQPPEEQLVVWVEKLVTPLDRPAQSPLMTWHVPPSR